MPKIILFVLLSLLAFQSNAQRFTISGSIKDAANGEDLFGAAVVVKELTNVGTTTNAYGFYSLTLDQGEYTLIFRSTGFDNFELKISLNADITQNVELKVPTDVQQLGEVQVNAVKENDNITSTEMNVTRFDPKSIETIPVLFGEKDIMKTLQLTPGVKGAGEGNAGFFVRGGGADQNLILLDEAPVYNASHLLGFFSVFNSDAIKDVSLYKSGIPAEYGGRASSVMDVKMRDGNNKGFGASGGLGLISSRLTIEGPIVKNKGSFIVSGRRSYADLFLGLAKNQDVPKDTKLFFYDLNAKANYRITEKDRIFLSGYFGRDRFQLGDVFGFSWGNATGTLRWNHIINQKLFSNTTVVYSNFNYEFTIGAGDDGFGIRSSIQDWNVKQDFDYFLNKNNTLKFGINAIHHTFKPGALTGSNESFNEIVLTPRYAVELGAYIQNEMKIGSRINIMYGLRYSGFDLIGKGNAYEFDAKGNQLSSTSYDSWETIKYHQGIEPRLSASFIISENNSIKLGYNRNFQYLHQLSNSTTSSPTDVWVPSSNNVKPQIGDQIALGYYQNLNKNMYRISTEIYYKHLSNQIDYRNGANLVLNDQVEGELVYGKGKAYGFELQVEKKKGKFTGWISYTLSRSLRQFDDIDNGDWFSARQDRIHDFAIVLMYRVTKSIAISANWIYYTGNAVTFPSGKYEVNGQIIPYYTERNGYRMPDYHRLDLGFTWYMKDRKHFEHNLNVSVYNAYARENAYTITFQDNPDNPGETQAVQTSLFKIVPSVTYNFTIK
ncbi:MAG: collagen-binding protein [Bacteroidetes bacterium RIFCSPHIGHO2_02_FULL_44_7]|nr:MAG: collagen-binding protein [Bacteroidetes bacterium RIFCSPHIGHO2_02_FULL_44_7]